MNVKQTSVAAFLAGAAAILAASEAGVLPYSRQAGPDMSALPEARAEAESLRSDLDAANRRVAALTASVEDLQGQVDRLSADLVARDTALDAAATEAAGQVERIARLNVMVAERDAAFGELTATVAARDARVAELDEALAANGLAVADDAPAAAVPVAASLDASGDTKILADPADTEIAAATLSTPDGPETRSAPTGRLAIFEQALSAAKPLPDLPPALGNAAMTTASAQPSASRAEPLVQVHFETASARLTPGGRLRALAAATVLAGRDTGPIRVTGHTDTTGGAEANGSLSRARAQAVADLLVEAGVPRGRIEVAGMGEDGASLPIPTADGVSEPLNRCAGIYAAL